MENKVKNNRSLLSIAGQSIINHHNQYQNNKIINETQHVSLKPIILKLGLHRLRKMQALVRGFLVRRKIYPKKL